MPRPPCYVLRIAAMCAASVLVCHAPAAHAQLPSGGYQLERIGLTGPGYEYTTAGGLRSYSSVRGVNAAGHTGGESRRYSASGVWLGDDAWVRSGGSTQLVGLTGGVYQMTTPNGVFRRQVFNQLSAAGQAAGETFRLANASDQFGSLGRDAWFFNGGSTQQIGLLGGQFEYAAAGGQYRFSSPTFVDDGARVAGFSNRYATDGTLIGIEAWVYSGGSTTSVGLSGPGYEVNDGTNIRRTSRVQAFENGYAAGVSGKVSATGIGLGTESWLNSGATTQVIGLTGAGYDVTSPDGVARQNQAILVNANGQAAGYAARFGATGSDFLGYDAWLFGGATTQLVGLTGDGYEWTMPAGNLRATLPVGLNEAGHVVGQTSRVTYGGEPLGNDAWIFDGTSSRRLGLDGPGYQYTTTGGVYRNSGLQTTLMFNDASQVAGVATRYDASGGEEGQAGWFYDLATDAITPLVFSVQTGTNEAYTDPRLVTDDGVVLGLYDKYDGATLVGRRPFWWSLADGFHDLGDLVPGGLAAAGWASLRTVAWQADDLAGDGPEYIVGTGFVAGQDTTAPAEQSAYLLTAIAGPAELLADFNNDTKVDKDDLAAWAGGFGVTSGAAHGQGDADGNGAVDGADLLIWQRELGAGGASAATTASVPEPRGAVLIVAGMAALVVRGRKRSR